MTKHLILILAASLAAAAAWAHEGHGQHDEAAEKPAAGAQTMKGEVVDLSCYLSEQAKGGEHAKCAKTCLTKEHAGAGLLSTDGKLYALVADHQHMKVMPAVCELGGEKVKLTGSVVSTGGLQAMLVQKVEKDK